jgi:class 3 adenylate cyclase
MATEDFKRKLTAILSADVKGYSRLMGEDEEATVRTITTYREVITEVVQKHRGRVVDSPGDNILAEFASVVDAVRGAVEMQEELKVRNAELPENRKMELKKRESMEMESTLLPELRAWLTQEAFAFPGAPLTR